MISSTIPNFVERAQNWDFESNKVLANQIADNLNRIKGEVDSDLDSSGDLNMDELLVQKINQKAKIPNTVFDIFDDEIEVRGLDVYFVLDCSWSMSRAGNQLREIASTIYEALEKCDFIDFKTVCFSGAFNRELYVQRITSKDDLGMITADRNNRGTCTDLALNFVNQEIKSGFSETRKSLVILFTDGLPEDNLSFDQMQNSISEEIVKMKNGGISFFTLFYENMAYYKDAGYLGRAPEIKRQMEDIFKGSIYTTRNFEDIQKMLIRNLETSVENINQNSI